MSKRRRRYKRGYALAVLVGFEERKAVLWRVFSEVVKLDGSVEWGGAEKEGLYDFHQSIVNRLRPVLKEGVRSIVITAPARTDYAKRFLGHIRKHDAWLLGEGDNAATFEELTGSATQLHEVHELVKSKEFRDAISGATSRDAQNIAASLEKTLGSDRHGSVVLYSLEEIEELIDARQEQSGLRPEHVVLTNRCLENTKVRGRMQRLLRVSQNKGIRTTIINAETAAGLRLTQLGGLVCFAKSK
ncbi:MAG: hypothetical protein V1857_00835 [archaeon]